MARACQHNDFEIHRFGHWANGWFEIVIVRPDTPVAALAEEFENCLSEYHTIDDSEWSEAEWNAALEAWRYARESEREELLEKAGLRSRMARRRLRQRDAWPYNGRRPWRQWGERLHDLISESLEAM